MVGKPTSRQKSYFVGIHDAKLISINPGVLHDRNQLPDQRTLRYLYGQYDFHFWVADLSYVQIFVYGQRIRRARNKTIPSTYYGNYSRLDTSNASPRTIRGGMFASNLANSRKRVAARAIFRSRRGFADATNDRRSVPGDV